MIIKKLTLHNFRNFPNTSIDFSIDKDKKFTIILGQNTFGKTTLVRSFIWCLYRVTDFGKSSLLNDDVAKKMLPATDEIVSVEIELFHGDAFYKIKTEETYNKSTSGKISVIKKAFTTVIKMVNTDICILKDDNAINEIESILRHELRGYFFFDGETNSIETISNKGKLDTAVTNIMGIEKIKFIKEYFDPNRSDTVTASFRRELNSTDTVSLVDAQAKLEQYISEKSNTENRINELKTEIDSLETQLDMEENKLNANRDIIGLQGEKHKLERKLEQTKTSIEDNFNRLIKAFNSNDAILKTTFASCFKKYNLKSLLDETSFNSDNSYKGITEEAVNEIILRGQCICGCHITKDSEAYKYLLNAKQHMEPHDYGKYISDFMSAEETNLYSSDTIVEGIRDLAGSEADYIRDIDIIEKKIKDIKEKLLGRTDTSEIMKRKSTIDRQIGQKHAEIKGYTDQLLKINNNLDLYKSRVMTLTKKSESNKLISRCIQYCENLYTLANKNIINSKNRIQQMLQSEVSNIFKQMYHGTRNIIIDENFKVTAISSDSFNKDLDKSTGLETVINYSFVAGLMNLAKNFQNDDDILKEDYKDNHYPIVMDAPFSNTDDTHIRNICNSLPLYCDQIIMFVMEKDFKYANDTICDLIGAKYSLKQISETESVIIKEDI